MAQPMLSIKEADPRPARSVANLLPCHVHHDGPIGSMDTYWNPNKGEDGTDVAFFRGRRLKGKTVALPEEYRGIVVEREASEAKQANGDSAHEDIDMADENAEKPVETGSLRATAEFDKVVIWGHEAVASAEEDPYIRSIEEWLQVSEKIHAYPEAQGTDGK